MHHGNGTQACVEDDPTLFYASSHQWPCYPGTGHPKERGVGNVCNAILPPGADGAAFRTAWGDMLLPALDAFAPELIVVPPASMRTRPTRSRSSGGGRGLRLAHRPGVRSADRHCGGRVVSLLEGGYDLRALADSVAAHVRCLMRD